jgi:hypothetical protein
MRMKDKEGSKRVLRMALERGKLRVLEELAWLDSKLVAEYADRKTKKDERIERIERI